MLENTPQTLQVHAPGRYCLIGILIVTYIDPHQRKYTTMGLPSVLYPPMVLSHVPSLVDDMLVLQIASFASQLTF